MPKDTQKPGGARQRPISCRFCRTRKLRCSRDSPCSNCVSRNIPCELEQFSNTTPTVDNRERDELLERIRKLEALVATKCELVTSNDNPTPSPSVETQLDPVISHNVTASSHIHSPNAKGHAIASREQFDQDCAYLKDIFYGEELTPDEIPSTKIGYVTSRPKRQKSLIQSRVTSVLSSPPLMKCLLISYSNVQVSYMPSRTYLQCRAIYK
ncbi:hypothetical protein DM02DRAFT_17373 [Periconia macrospinosa]|uniref:Zn(2)-C6 fungal-type domain-containing protein n=1 Tax=Periconia macrospinosa TaxID=97972 RepID=A0A2V1E8J7_9PLEO|nr:hypothetical protein DM02DRAFT_17373 [Periconia macrospinosa]